MYKINIINGIKNKDELIKFLAKEYVVCEMQLINSYSSDIDRDMNNLNNIVEAIDNKFSELIGKEIN